MNAFAEITLDSDLAAAPALPPLEARLPEFARLKVSPRDVFAALRVLLIGAGSVGDPLAVDLARLRPAVIRLVDPKRHKPEGLLTQAMPWDVGQAKAVVTGRRCKALSPDTRVLAFEGPAEDVPLADWADSTLVVMAPDNLAAEAFTGARCAALGVPLVHGSVEGSSLSAEVRVFSNAHAAAPCPACLFNPGEVAAWRAESRFSCDGSAPAGVKPTRSLAFLCRQAASLAGLQIIRLLLGLGAPVVDTLLSYHAMSHRTFVTPLATNPTCAARHERWARVALSRSLEECSFADLADAAGVPWASASMELVGHEFIEKAVCACAAPVPVHRFVPRALPVLPRCETCHQALRRVPFFTRRTVPGALLAALAIERRSLAEYCDSPPGGALLRHGDSVSLVLHPETPPSA